MPNEKLLPEGVYAGRLVAVSDKKRSKISDYTYRTHTFETTTGDLLHIALCELPLNAPATIIATALKERIQENGQATIRVKHRSYKDDVYVQASLEKYVERS